MVWYTTRMDKDKDFGLFIGFRNVLLFYLVSAVLVVTCVYMTKLFSYLTS